MTTTDHRPFQSQAPLTQHGPPTSKLHRETLLWVSVGLALAAAFSYVLMALGVLRTNVLLDEAGKNIPWVAAGGYTLGGLLILLRRRWLWIIGFIINDMVILMFYTMHWGDLAVLWSAGGVVSKVAQILLAATLLDLIITDWRADRAQSRR